MSASLMPRPTQRSSGAEPRSTVCAAPRKGSPGLVRICAASIVGVKVLDSAAARFGSVGAKGSGLNGDETGAGACGFVVAAETALHELAREDGAFADGGHVADEHLAEARGERGGVVANLVGVREDDVVGRFGCDELLERGRESVGVYWAPAADARRERPWRRLWWQLRRRGLRFARRGRLRLLWRRIGQQASCAAARASQLMRLMRPSRSSRTT